MVTSTSFAAGRGDRLRVLVVEDEPDTAASLSHLLRLWGHEARAASDGVAAVNAFPRFRPDVVLLDLGLPGVDGYEVARRLRQRRGGDRALLVVISGYAQEACRRRAYDAGADLFLVKPADPQQLADLLGRPAAAVRADLRLRQSADGLHPPATVNTSPPET